MDSKVKIYTMSIVASAVVAVVTVKLKKMVEERRKKTEKTEKESHAKEELKKLMSDVQMVMTGSNFYTMDQALAQSFKMIERHKVIADVFLIHVIGMLRLRISAGIDLEPHVVNELSYEISRRMHKLKNSIGSTLPKKKRTNFNRKMKTFESSLSR